MSQMFHCLWIANKRPHLNENYIIYNGWNSLVIKRPKRGRSGFDSRFHHHCSKLAQLVARQAHNLEVGSSSLPLAHECIFINTTCFNKTRIYICFITLVLFPRLASLIITAPALSRFTPFSRITNFAPITHANRTILYIIQRMNFSLPPLTPLPLFTKYPT